MAGSSSNSKARRPCAWKPATRCLSLAAASITSCAPRTMSRSLKSRPPASSGRCRSTRRGANPQMSSARSNEYPIPATMKAWVLGDPEELSLVDKPVPEPGSAEVLVRIDAIAVCATDIEVLKPDVPALIDGGLPFNKGFTPGHEYMGTVVKRGPTVDEFAVGDRVAVEIHAGCGRCPRCREGMYTSCLNYGYRAKGHRANGFSTDGGFAEYAINNVNTMVHIPD